MKIALVFSDWRDGDGNRIYFTRAGVQLSAGDFHAGTTFSCEIDLDEDSAADLRASLESGYVPVFYAVIEDEPDDLTLCPNCGESWLETETIRADGSLGCPCRESAKAGT